MILTTVSGSKNIEMGFVHVSSQVYSCDFQEDLAEWFNEMYETEMDAFNFFDKLEDGVVLCRHANNIIDRAEKLKVVKITRLNGSPNSKDLKPRTFRRFTYRKQVQPGEFVILTI